MNQSLTLKSAEINALIAAALAASNVSQANAASVAKALTLAEIDGQKGHGLWRVPSYAAQAKVGKVDGHAVPTLRRTKGGAVMVDAAHGFAFPAFDLALSQLPRIARETGIAAAGFVRPRGGGRPNSRVSRGWCAAPARSW